MSNKQKHETMENFKNLDELLNSEEFNNFFDVEKEKEELEKDGWTYEEIREFAKSFKK